MPEGLAQEAEDNSWTRVGTRRAEGVGCEAWQAIAIRASIGGQLGNLAHCIEAAPVLLLTDELQELIDAQLETIRDQWASAHQRVRIRRSHVAEARRCAGAHFIDYPLIADDPSGP